MATRPPTLSASPFRPSAPIPRGQDGKPQVGGVSDPIQFPLPPLLYEAIPMQAQACEQSRKRLAEAQARYDEEIANVDRKHKPIIQKCQEQIALDEKKLQDLLQESDRWFATVKTKAIHDYTTMDVKMCLYSAKIAFDAKKVDHNQVTGQMFAACDAEDVVQSLLGVEAVGDATRVVKIVHALLQAPGVVVTRDVTADGIPAYPVQWSIRQFEDWAQSTSMKDLAPLLSKHRFAGDIIVGMDIKAVSIVLNLEFNQRIAFKKEISALQASVQTDVNFVTCEPQNSITTL
jgi:hypothetical protein